MQDFFAMGGYAAFVWPSYGLAVVILLWFLIASRHGLKAREAELRALETRGGHRRSRRSQPSAPAVPAAEAAAAPLDTEPYPS